MSSIRPPTLEYAPEPVTPAEPSRRDARLATLALVAVAAVIGAGLAGWSVHRPGTTTRTVSPPPYSSALTATGAVHFDGAHASYTGPAEVKTGTTLVLTLVTTAKGASLVVSRLSPAPSWATLTRDLATANTSPTAMPLGYVHHVATVDATSPTAVTLTRPGLYSLWAGPLTTPSPASVALATLVRVSG